MTIEERMAQLGVEVLSLYQEAAHWKSQAEKAAHRLKEIEMMIAEKEGRAAELRALNLEKPPAGPEEEEEGKDIEEGV